MADDTTEGPLHTQKKSGPGRRGRDPRNPVGRGTPKFVDPWAHFRDDQLPPSALQDKKYLAQRSVHRRKDTDKKEREAIYEVLLNEFRKEGQVGNMSKAWQAARAQFPSLTYATTFNYWHRGYPSAGLRAIKVVLDEELRQAEELLEHREQETKSQAREIALQTFAARMQAVNASTMALTGLYRMLHDSATGPGLEAVTREVFSSWLGDIRRKLPTMQPDEKEKTLSQLRGFWKDLDAHTRSVLELEKRLLGRADITVGVFSQQKALSTVAATGDEAKHELDLLYEGIVKHAENRGLLEAHTDEESP